jgi:hypothetical protein
MSRQSKNREVGFGSDSFLDIVANIVGILIILIVIAGLRVSHAPVKAVVETVAEFEAEESDPLPPDGPELPQSPFEPDREGIVQPMVIAEPPRLIPTRPPGPPEKLVLLARELEADIEAIYHRSADFSAAIQRATVDDEQVQSRLAATEQALTTQKHALQAVQKETAVLGDSLEQTRRRLLDLKRELNQAEEAQTAAEKLEHRLAPISHTVETNELHFRLLNDRVVPVPVDELSERLKAQIDRQKDWLVKFRQHQGTVGPINGFVMNYVVERQQMSVIDELRLGRGVVKIGVSRWELVADPDLKAETLDQALARGSNFVQALQAADEKTAITFWVYPDSFKLFRELKRVIQAEGLVVAARPLPFGTPIAGSPQGTRSKGQ